MKTLLTLLAALLIHCAHAQNYDEGKFSLGLKAYTPIYLTGTDKFYNDNWILYQPQSRSYYKYAFGADVRYALNPNIALSLWGGLSRRSLKEESYNEFYNNCMGCGGELEKTFEGFEYTQNSFNTSLALILSEKVRKFKFNTGIELSYLHTGKGKQEYVGWWMEYEDPNLPDSNYAVSNTVISSGNSFGLGLFVGMEYLLAKRISLGVNFTQYLYYSLFKGTTTGSWSDYRRNLGTETTYQEGTFESKDNFTQFAASRIVPAFELRYYF